MIKTEKSNNTSIEAKYTLIKDRIEIYKDFTYNLLSYIYDYYLDRETLSLDEDIRNHFMFCYNKVCNEFLEQEIDFRYNNELIEYFYIYYYHHFYRADENIEKEFFVDFWNMIFDINNPKNDNIMKIMTELYRIFDTSISNNKNILELM
jgi:hypothetical protein